MAVLVQRLIDIVGRRFEDLVGPARCGLHILACAGRRRDDGRVLFSCALFVGRKIVVANRFCLVRGQGALRRLVFRRLRLGAVALQTIGDLFEGAVFAGR